MVRDSWWSAALCGVGLQLAFVVFPQIGGNPWLAAILIPALFALAAGSIAFAGETESGTDDLLRSWSAPPGIVLGSKLLVASVLTLLLGTLLFASSGILANLAKHSLDGLRWGIASSGVLLASGMLLTAVFASFFARRTLSAVCLTTLLWFLTNVRITTGEALSSDASNATSLYLLFIVLIADIILVRWWVRRPFPTWSNVREYLSSQSLVRFDPLQRWLADDPGHYRHLLWREGRLAFRQAPLMLAIQIGMILIARYIPHHYYSTFEIQFWLFTFGICLYFGMQSFHHDQQDSLYRFLSERGTSPLRVWLSKQTIWLPMALIAAGVSLVGQAVNYPRTTPPLAELGMLGLIYLCSQCVSSFVRGAAFALTLSGMLAGAIYVWVILFHELTVPFWIAIGPIPFTLLLLSFLRTRDLLCERNDWRSLRKHAGVSAATLLAILFATAVFRVVQIPSVAPLKAPSYVVTPSSRQTGALYAKAAVAIKEIQREMGPDGPIHREIDVAQRTWDQLQPAERDWLLANGTSLRIAFQASARPDCTLVDPNTLAWDTPLYSVQELRDLADLLLLSARQHEAAGELDQAFDCYAAIFRMARHGAHNGGIVQWHIARAITRKACEAMLLWAAHPHQSVERIRKAIAVVDEHRRTFPSLRAAAELIYHLCRPFVLDSSVINDPKRHHWIYQTAALLLPWERMRSFRLFDELNLPRIRKIGELETQLQDPMDSGAFPGHDSFEWQYSAQEKEWLRLTLGDDLSFWGATKLNQFLLNKEADLRGVMVALALYGYKLEHGAFPERLDPLVGPWLEQMPVDPFTGQDFGYRPDGFPHPIVIDGDPPVELPADTPLLWSAGPRRLTVWPSRDGDQVRSRFSPARPTIESDKWIESNLFYILP